MSLNYALFNNPLTTDTDDLIARVQNVETVEFQEVMKMLTRRGLTTTDTEAESVVNELIHTINEVVSSGKSVITPFANYRLSIKGVFNHSDDLFESSIHKVKINCSAGKNIKIDYDTLKLEKVRAESAHPEIDKFIDYATQKENELISSTGTAEIKGELLKLDPEDADQGIFFIAGDGTEKRVEIYMRNKPSDIIFNIPAGLLAGNYILEIRNKNNGSNKLRRQKFNQELEVL